MTTETNTATEEMPSASAKATPSKRPRAAAKKVEPASPETVAPAEEEVSVSAKPKRKVAADAVPPIVPEVTKAAKPKKAKLVRDSFTMPDAEYQAIAAIKKRCLGAGVAAKKSEVLRAAVKSLAVLSDEAIVAMVQGLDTIKTGRPARNTK